MFLFIVLGVVVVLLLIYFKKHSPVNTVDKSAWDEEEKLAIKILKQRLETGDLTQQEYDEKLKEIENNRK